MNDNSLRIAWWANIWYWLVGAIVVAYAGSLALLTDFIADDAYIVAHYARGFVQTGDITFNDNEQINALTSPLHFFVEALLYAITGSLIPAYRVLSVLMVIGAAVIIARRFQSTAAQLVALLTVLVTAQMMTWTMGGLDTPIVLLLMSLLLTLVYGRDDFDPRLLYPIMITAGLGYLSRPDSVLVSVPFVLYAIYRARNIPHTLGAAAVGAVLPLAWLIYAQTTFGDIFPTSYYTKQPTLEWTPAGRNYYGKNALYVAYHIVTIPGVWLIALWGGLMISTAPKQVVPAVKAFFGRTWWIYPIAPGLIVYGMTSSTTHMMFTFRLLIPYVLPVLAVLPADLFQHSDPLSTTSGATNESTVNKRIFAAALLVLIGSQVAHAYIFLHFDGESTIKTYQAGRGTLLDHTQIVDMSREAAHAIDAHWNSLDEPSTDVPHIWTFMGGIVPYELPDAYIYESLASWREGCPTDVVDISRLIAGSNYLHYYVFYTPGWPPATFPYHLRYVQGQYELIYHNVAPIRSDSNLIVEMGVLYKDGPVPPQRLPADMGTHCDQSEWPLPVPFTWLGG